MTERGGQKVTKVFAGYKDRPDSWVMDPVKKLATELPPWLDKKTGKQWYAGKQYDDDMANAKAALTNLAKIYPGYQGQGYELAGFVWWQGNKDQNAVRASRYEQNLARLIPQLRKDYTRRTRSSFWPPAADSPGARASACKSAKPSLPARAGLLTGRHQWRFGHKNNPAYDPIEANEGLPLTELRPRANCQALAFCKGRSE